ncbi:MAG: FAD-binding oxidoreductase [Burkholderiaceae bacterium]|nr:FAD-binding oxidoreductase [Burkholderiaceae bacterium]
MADAIATTPPGEDWLAPMRRLAGQTGFLGAWTLLQQAMLDAVRSGQPAPALTQAQLRGLMAADPALAGCCAQLSAPAEALKTTPLAAGAPSWTTQSGVNEANGRPVACLSSTLFQNWGRTVSNTPALTCFPTTKAGVAAAVQWACANGKQVRVAGYRHTWTEFYSNDNEVLISLLPLSVVNDLPASEPPIDPSNELQGIAITGYVNEQGQQKALCRIGSATTNEQFRQWCLATSGGAWNWTLPLNVIMVEITFGGSNAPICHGAGWRNQTLSDLVTEIEFVNALGQLQTVSDPQVLRAAAGAFGLLGVVTAVTLKLDAMSFAALKPVKTRLALAVPPPAGYVVPAQVDVAGVTPQALAAAQQDFISRCESDYYAEWFWFTFQPDCWINTWKNDGQRAQAVDYPSPMETRLQEVQEYLAGLLVDSGVFNALPQTLQALALGTSAMSFLPVSGATAPLIDGLHFRRGIQNMRVLDTEFEIPIPARADNPALPDWSVCQRAWWDAIAVVYSTLQASGTAPMRLTLEMRIMAGSNVTMAPQYGNTLGTCSIEVLTTINTDKGEWTGFMQRVADAWSQYRDAAGRPLNLRPHWAKQWQGLTLGGQAIEDYLRTVAYKDRLPEFRDGLLAVAEAGGYALADMQQRFSNPLINRVFAPVFG